MTTQTDVKAGHLNASGQITTFRTRVKGFICTATATNTEILIYDSATGAVGEPILRFDSGTTVTTFSILVPGEGMLVRDGVYAELGAGGVTLTVFYG